MRSSAECELTFPVSHTLSHEGVAGPLGAVYYDEASGSSGVARNGRDKDEAEKVVKTVCSSDGAQDCRAVLSCRNACVAVGAWDSFCHCILVLMGVGICFV
ncbi:DUF4189 domain-containing protein [Xanthomonas chitinilytica]|uniref:DUF4189 domain-containing protein n=1 Tax=Xanthomonas chitinilytica TaxID=2989819 RepID=UPI003CCD3810